MPEEEETESVQQKGKLHIWKLLLVIFLALFGFYFIQSEDALDTALKENNYPQALSCAKRMPWLFLRDSHLTPYLEAHAAIARKDVFTAVQIFEQLGGYRDSTELCLAYATINQAGDLITSADTDALLAGYEKLKELQEQTQQTDATAQEAYIMRLYQEGVGKIGTNPTDAIRLLQAIPSYEPAHEALTIAKIMRDFETNASDTIYEDTYRALRAHARHPAAVKLFVSDHFINLYLEGRWESADGEWYYEHRIFDAKEGTGEHETNFSHPVAIGSEYRDGQLWIMTSEDSEPYSLYTFIPKGKDQMEVKNHYMDETHMMHRVSGANL